MLPQELACPVRWLKKRANPAANRGGGVTWAAGPGASAASAAGAAFSLDELEAEVSGTFVRWFLLFWVVLGGVVCLMRCCEGCCGGCGVVDLHSCPASSLAIIDQSACCCCAAGGR